MPDDTIVEPTQIIADLQRTLQQRTAERDAYKTERDEALSQQSATAEVLGVINASPGDLTPVFDAMLERAMRLCGADFGTFALHEGGLFKTAATRGVPTAFVEYRKNNPPPYGPGTVVARILETRA